MTMPAHNGSEDGDSEDRPTGLQALQREAYDWVARFAAGDARPVDLAAFRRWAARSPAHEAAFARASLFWKVSGSAGQELLAEGIATQDAGRQPIMARPARLGRRAVLGGALAASAAGVAAMVIRPPLGLWPSWSELRSDYRTEPGAQRQIALADHVSVKLNTRTSIALRSIDGQADRIELIAGELAVATVPETTRPVIVAAGDGQTMSTAGTRFNVLYEDHVVCVTCVEGAVQVTQGASSVRLSAGRQTTYSDRGLGQVVAIDPAVVTAWQSGIIIFQSTPVSQVVAEINRYRPGRVILTNPELGRGLFNARIEISRIDQVIGQIAEVFDAHVTLLPGGIVLLG
jgi:transmembrane sensor